MVASVASRISRAASDFTRLSQTDQRTDPVETIASELMPLCAALHFIGRQGPGILQTRRFGLRGRPPWLWGVTSYVRRDPFGRVLILGTWNYPLLLTGVQAAQALAAGNSVLIKPAPGTESVTSKLVDCFCQAGIPESQLRQLDSSIEAATTAIDDGVDLIVLTGAASTGRNVLNRAARSLTPCIMELSGCDAVIVMPAADLSRVADAIRFGLNFNGGATCIGPRRVIVEETMAEQLLEVLLPRIASSPIATLHPAARASAADMIEDSIARGAVDRLGHFDAATVRSHGEMRPVILDCVTSDHAIASADLFAPISSIIRVGQIEGAVKLVNQCRYRLAASVFGPAAAATKMAAKLRVGSVTINDLIAPTADPRLPFGGRGESGFGVTRGAEGLLAMTVPTSVSLRRGRLTPHLTPRRESDAGLLIGALQLFHGGSLRDRWAGLRQTIAAVKKSRKPGQDDS